MPAARPAVRRFQRQTHHWQSQGLVTTITRPLRYRPTAWDASGQEIRSEAREKGIDVLIALDLLRGAVQNEYDVAVLFSADTDLVPAVAAVLDVGKRIELAAWRPDTGFAARLQIPGWKTWCHMLDRTDYQQLHDPTDYTYPVR